MDKDGLTGLNPRALIVQIPAFAGIRVGARFIAPSFPVLVCVFARAPPSSQCKAGGLHFKAASML